MAEKQVTLITKENFDKEKQRVDGHFGEVDNNLLNLDSIKADKTELASTNAKLGITNRSLSALWDLSEGKTYRFETDEDVAYTKDVLSGARLADLQMMGGKSLVWNQLCAEMRVRSGGLTLIPIDEYTVRAVWNSSSSEEGQYSICNLNKHISVIANHHYYMNVNSVIPGDVYFQIRSGGALQACPTLGGGISKGIVIANSSDDASFMINIGSSVNSYDLTLKPQAVDLTQIFGQGNEPTSVDDPRIAMIETYLEAHPEYNEGSIVSNEVDEVVSVGKNLLDVESHYDKRDFTYSDESLSSTATDTKDYFNLYVQCKKQDKSSFIVATSATYNTIGRKTKAFSITEPVYFGFKHNGSKKDLWVVSNETYADALLLNPGDYVLSFDLEAFNPSVVGGLKLKNIQLEKTSTATPYSPYFESTLPIPTELQNIEGYGWGINDDVYNYVDFEPKVYHNMKSVDLGEVTDWKRDSGGFWYTTNRAFINKIEQTNTTNVLGEKYYISQIFKPNNNLFRVITPDADTPPYGILHYEATEGGEDYEARLFHKRVDRVDLGLIPSNKWNWGGDGLLSIDITIKKQSGLIMCAKYPLGNPWAEDKVMYSGVALTLKDSDYKNLNEAIEGLSGVHVYYELATEQIYDVTDILKDFDTNIDVESGGTLTFHNKNEGYHIPIPNREEYAVKISEVN